MVEPEILELGTVAILFLFAIREFFTFLKAKKQSNDTDETSDLHEIKKDIALMQQQLTNHMTDYNKCINRTESLVEKNSESIDEIKTTLIRLEAIVRK
jgi:hypothetical protein